MPPQTGALRHRVRIERRVEIENGFGSTVSDWQAVMSRWAAIDSLRGREEVIGARLEGIQPATVVLRYDAQTAAITPADRLVEVASGVVYAITAAADMDHRRAWVTLTCVSGKTP